MISLCISDQFVTIKIITFIEAQFNSFTSQVDEFKTSHGRMTTKVLCSSLKVYNTSHYIIFVLI